MDDGRFMTPIRFRIEKLLPGLIKKYSPKIPKVLDHGCGRGMYSQLFKRFKKYNYVGIDIGRKDSWKRYSSKSIKYDIQDGTKLKFKNNFFNMVLSITSLEHIKDDKKAVAEIYRVAKKGSYVIIIVPTRPYWLFQLGRHCHHHNTKKQLIKLIKSKPFSIVEYQKIGGPLSFLFTWADIWLSQAIVLPFWLLRKLSGKPLTSEEIEKILDNSLHCYTRFKCSQRIYLALMRFIDVFDRVVPILANHHLVILQK